MLFSFDITSYLWFLVSFPSPEDSTQPPTNQALISLESRENLGFLPVKTRSLISANTMAAGGCEFSNIVVFLRSFYSFYEISANKCVPLSSVTKVSFVIFVKRCLDSPF